MPAAGAALPAAWPECPSQKLEASGNYMLRSGWQPADTFIHLRAGRLGGGHGHGDLLHLDVWHGGEAVLVDPGRLTYVDGPRRQALKSPAAHNTLRLDETDFTQYRATWEWENIAQPLPARAHFDPAADYLFAGHGGYLSRGALVERRLVFLKPDLLVGADLIRSAGGHQAEAYFHFGQGTLTLNPRSVFWKGSRTCAQLHWLSGQTGCAFESPRAPVYNTLFTGPSLRLTASTSGTTALVWVLSLGGPCDARLVPVTDGAGKPIASRLAQGVRVDKDGQSRTVLFSWQAGPHEAGLLCADGCTGYGTVLAFVPQCPEGLYLD